jgi:hypothetical protein
MPRFGWQSPVRRITFLWHAILARNHQHGGTMSLQARIESLKERHAHLDLRIFDEDHRPRPDTLVLTRLKSEKLKLKEEMERLRSS